MITIKAYLFNPSAISFIGAIVAAIGVFLKTKRSKELVFFGALIVAIGAFWEAGQSRSFEMKVQAKDEEIKKLNDYILSTITGGDSYCCLSLSSINSVTNSARMFACHMGEYPLYDVSFRIVDLEKFEKIVKDKELTFNNIMRNDINISVGNISPGSSMVLREINLGYENEKNFNVFISSRNGFVVQRIRLKRIGGKWVMATKVMKGDTKLYEIIDEKFPKNKDGSITWD